MAASAKGLRLNIYRWSLGDCSAGGISGRCNFVTLVGILDKRKKSPTVEPIPEAQAGPFAPTDDAPPVVLVYRQMGERMLCHVEPLLGEDDPGFRQFGTAWFMMGGTFVDGDSRFGELIGFYGAVAFHDRREW